MPSIQKATRKKGVVYVARWYDARRIQQTKTFPTKEAALRHVRAEEARAANGDLFDHRAGKAMYETIYDEWINSKVFPKERTRSGYESLGRTHVLPYFGNVAVARITKRDVQSWVKELTDSGVGAGTIRNAYRNVLKPSLDYAVDHGYLRANPALNVKIAASQRTEMAFLSAAQVRQLADEITPHYRLMILFAAFTGLRAGEVAALRVGRLDLMRRTVHVAESASVVTGKGIVYGPTKTYAVRTVPVPSFLVDDLAHYIADRAADPNALVFTSPTGAPLHHGNFYRRHFRPAVARAAIESAKDGEPFPAGLRFHDLRHTCAALMIDTNANPYAISKRLGHSSITVTYDRYGHRFPHQDEAITSGLEAAWSATLSHRLGKVGA
jgi:integrase